MAGPAYTFRYIPAREDLDERADLPHGGIANSITDPVSVSQLLPPQLARAAALSAPSAPAHYALAAALGAAQ